MLTWKEKLFCLMASLAINFLIFYFFATVVKPAIREAVQGAFIMMGQDVRRETPVRSGRVLVSPREPTK
jgi:hypothetical protein